MVDFRLAVLHPTSSRLVLPHLHFIFTTRFAGTLRCKENSRPCAMCPSDTRILCGRWWSFLSTPSGPFLSERNAAKRRRDAPLSGCFAGPHEDACYYTNHAWPVTVSSRRRKTAHRWWVRWERAYEEDQENAWTGVGFGKRSGYCKGCWH